MTDHGHVVLFLCTAERAVMLLFCVLTQVFVLLLQLLVELTLFLQLLLQFLYLLFHGCSTGTEIKQRKNQCVIYSLCANKDVGRLRESMNLNTIIYLKCSEWNVLNNAD